MKVSTTLISVECYDIAQYSLLRKTNVKWAIFPGSARLHSVFAGAQWQPQMSETS